MKIEPVLLALILVGTHWLVAEFQLPYGDEIWLISGLVLGLVLYWIKPREENYLKFTGPLLLVIVGAYLVAVKAPKLLSGLMNYRLAQLCCLTLYGILGWLIVKRWGISNDQRRINNQV